MVVTNVQSNITQRAESGTEERTAEPRKSKRQAESRKVWEGEIECKKEALEGTSGEEIVLKS